VLTALKQNAFAYPLLEVAHLLGISLLIGNLVLLELRVFGRGASLPIKDLARLSLVVAVTGFCIAAATGLTMFATQAEDLINNGAFKLKMLLLFVAACNAGYFHGRDSLDKLDWVAKAQMVASMLLWISIATCGRWIAYK
jgi:hypothetical protein